METQAKQQYNMLRKAGDLLDLYPELTGESWGKDKVLFMDIYLATMNGIIDIDLNFEEDEY